VKYLFGEPLNGFAPNSQKRRVWSLAQMSLKVKVTRAKNDIFRWPACGLFGKPLASSFQLVFTY